MSVVKRKKQEEYQIKKPRKQGKQINQRKQKNQGKQINQGNLSLNQNNKIYCIHNIYNIY